MRLCLTCRRLSADGPICTSCGRSFGGRLCEGKKKHLNPPTAQFCGQCGSTSLRESTTSIPFGWGIRLLLWGTVLVALLWCGPSLWGGVSRLFATQTGYRDPLVWPLDKSLGLAVTYGFFYFLASLMPGEPGKLIRTLMTKTAAKVLGVSVLLLHRLIVSLCKVVVGFIQGTKTKN